MRSIEDLSFPSAEELQMLLGKRIASIRLRKNMRQLDLASLAGVSTRALAGLEGGEGSSLLTLFRVLNALGIGHSGVDALAPEPTVSPMELLRVGHRRKRAASKTKSK